MSTITIAFVASEYAPLVKVGGIADVVGSLPHALQKLQADVCVILPYYDVIERSTEHKKILTDIPVTVNATQELVDVYTTKHRDVTLYFIDNKKYIANGGIYSSPGKALTPEQSQARFLFFSKAVATILSQLPQTIDVMHLHDWHAAGIALLLNNQKNRPKTVLTLHNVAYQGVWNKAWTAAFLEQPEDSFVCDDKTTSNILKTGIRYSDLVTTVSPTYAKEITKGALSHDLHKVLNQHPKSIIGIINGIDQDIFNPQTDKHIHTNYSLETLHTKAKNKVWLQEQLKLTPDEHIPMIGVVTRLVQQKGIDWFAEIIPKLVKHKTQVVVLGTGDTEYEELLTKVAKQYPSNVRALIEFDIAKAQQIYAASDMFVISSRFEPCGLTQMIAMRYGTIPVVRATGGLKDTVDTYSIKNGTVSGNGFVYKKPKAKALYAILKQALLVYNNHPDHWKILQKNAITRDFSWGQSANKYYKAYQQLLDN